MQTLTRQHISKRFNAFQVSGYLKHIVSSVPIVAKGRDASKVITRQEIANQEFQEFQVFQVSHSKSETMTTNTTPNMTCPECGSRHVVHKPKGGHLGLYCECGHWYRWEKQPWTVERAQAFVLFAGKHANKSLSEVVKTDRAYVEWLASKTDNGNVGIAARILLAHPAPFCPMPGDMPDPSLEDDCPF